MKDQERIEYLLGENNRLRGVVEELKGKLDLDVGYQSLQTELSIERAKSETLREAIGVIARALREG
jgi:hypothetical protein